MPPLDLIYPRGACSEDRTHIPEQGQLPCTSLAPAAPATASVLRQGVWVRWGCFAAKQQYSNSTCIPWEEQFGEVQPELVEGCRAVGVFLLGNVVHLSVRLFSPAGVAHLHHLYMLRHTVVSHHSVYREKGVPKKNDISLSLSLALPASSPSLSFYHPPPLLSLEECPKRTSSRSCISAVLSSTFACCSSTASSRPSSFPTLPMSRTGTSPLVMVSTISW